MPDNPTSTKSKKPSKTLLSAQLFGQFIEQSIQIFIGLARLLDLFDRVQHRGMVFSAKLSSDFWQRSFRQVLGQLHGDLPRIDNGSGVVLGLNLDEPQTELLCHRFLDGLDGDLASLGIDEILEHLLGIGQRDLRSY